MFKFLKEKIQGWTEKIKEEFSEKEVEIKKNPKTKEKKGKKNEKKTKEPKSSKKTKEKSKKKGKKENITEQTREKTVQQETAQEILNEVKPVKNLKNEVLKDKDSSLISRETFFSEESKPQEKPGFFSKLFTKKEENKTAELVIEDIQKEGEKIESPEERFEVEQEEKKGFFDKFKKKITEEKFEELFQELEMIMLQNNVAYDAVQTIKKKLAEELIGQNLSDSKINDSLKNAISDILINPPNFIKQIKEKLKENKPYVISFVGINGSGKTTTIAKVANLLKKEKLTVCLAAADTFRAAAIEQLETHANNLKVPIIKKEYNSDPAAVGFEAIAYAKKHGIDVVLIDTAGRLNTKDSLMKEMEKIIRVCNPDLKIFLGESITGNDATEQAKSFNEHISLDGIILSKADIDEKGGTSLSVSYITKKPIYFLGTGQSYDDLEVFDKDKIINNLGL